MRNLTRSLRYLPAAVAACGLLATAACTNPADPNNREEPPVEQEKEKPGQTGMILAPAPVLLA
ncbi:MAG TPA: hypothetical protein VFQ45_00590 [Longimicrobium sp.]|nr:hypothetical protein [Longimicrobium sp.]